MERYTLGRKAVQQIAKLVRENYRRPAHAQFGLMSQGQDFSLLIYIAKSPAGGIPARSSDTPGSAACDIYFINDDGDLEARKDSNDNQISQTVYNLSASAVAADTYIQCKQEIFSGKLLCDFEDCG